MKLQTEKEGQKKRKKKLTSDNRVDDLQNINPVNGLKFKEILGLKLCPHNRGGVRKAISMAVSVLSLFALFLSIFSDFLLNQSKTHSYHLIFH